MDSGGAATAPGMTSTGGGSRPALDRGTSLAVSPPPAILEDGESTAPGDDDLAASARRAKFSKEDSIKSLKDNIKEGESRYFLDNWDFG